MAWQLANEPRASLHRKNYLKWIETTANLIKSLDTNHLVSIGSEGNTTHPKINGVNALKDHQFSAIDYVTIHCWIQNWGWYNPEKPNTYLKAKQHFFDYLQTHLDISQTLNKPLVLEEFGIARDQGSHDFTSTTQMRDQFFSDVFNEVLKIIRAKQPIAGTNFWAWSGEGRPKYPKSIWQINDELTGDPPHEHQGWYSVYDTDESTLAVIKNYTAQINKITL